MVLSNRFATKTPRTLLQRTLLYVVGFGAGALAIALLMSFVVVRLMDGVLPTHAASKAGSDTAAGRPVRIIGGPAKAASKKGASRKRPSRANEASGAKERGAKGRL